MSLYAIGDLHLSLASNKPMDVFGGKWDKYIDKLKLGFAALKPDDICVLCGDISWGMSLDESLLDFKFIDELPGKKLIIKGNHDYWWNSAKKIKEFFDNNGIMSIQILHNNYYLYDDIAICGTRGWFYDEDSGQLTNISQANIPHDKKMMNRELIRLEASFKAAGDRAKRCFLHYPPLYNDYICNEIIELFKHYGVKSCHFGHIHGAGHRYAVEGLIDGIQYSLVSADYVDFKPVKVIE